MMLREASSSIQVQNGLLDGTSSKVCCVVGIGPFQPAVTAVILAIWPRVALALQRKYERLPGGTHGSPGPPQVYPLIAPTPARRSMNTQNTLELDTSSNVCCVDGIWLVWPAAPEMILESWPRVTSLPQRNVPSE